MALSDNTTKIHSLLTSINNLPSAGGGGTPLPSLTDPATASDILDGKEAIDGQGQVLTGTFIPPVDTGANGLYKSALESDVTELVDEGLTKLRSYAQYSNTSLVKVSLPNIQTVGQNAFRSCSSITGIVDLRTATISNNTFYEALRRTVVLKIARNSQGFQGSYAVHLWFPDGYRRAANYEYNRIKYTKSIQYDDMENSFSFIMSGGVNALEAFVIRKNTLISLTGTGLSGYDASVFRFYVPAALLNDYKTATNWTTYASLMVGIDEDTTALVGTLFTPTTSATATVDHWDQVDLQSYSVGTIDTTNGSITPTHDGRLLIRGLDASDNIVHVTYLQIGTGFDEEANLA